MSVEENLLLTLHVKDEFLENILFIQQMLWLQQGFPARFPAFVGAK